MRRLLLALLVAVSPAHAEELPSFFSNSFLILPEDVADAAKAGKRVMLYFGQDGCPYCKRLMEVNFRQRPTLERMKKHFVAVGFNIWGDREVVWTDGKASSEKQLAARLKVQFTPTLFFLDEKGAIALRLNGYHSPQRFDRALDYVAGRLEKKIPFPEYINDFDRGQQAGRQKIDLKVQNFFLPAPVNLRRNPGGRALAVLFETPNCAECEELHKIALQRKEVLEQFRKYDVARFSMLNNEFFTGIDGKKATPAGWAAALKIAHVPTLVLFDAGGREIMRLEAYFRPFHIAGALDYVSSGAYRREPSFQRFLQTKADRMRGRGDTVDLWK